MADVTLKHEKGRTVTVATGSADRYLSHGWEPVEVEKAPAKRKPTAKDAKS